MIEGQRPSIAFENLLHQLKVAHAVLLFPKDSPQHFAGGIINGSQQVQSRSPLFQPSMWAAIDLHQHALLSIAPPAAAMLRRLVGGWPTGLDNAPHGGAREDNALALL